MSEKFFKLQDLRGKLAEHHYKMTPQRKEILQVFIENEDDHHLSAEEAYEILKKKDFDFGLATVYRNLELLATLLILMTDAPATNLTPPIRKFINIIT